MNSQALEVAHLSRFRLVSLVSVDHLHQLREAVAPRRLSGRCTFGTAFSNPMRGGEDPPPGVFRGSRLARRRPRPRPPIVCLWEKARGSFHAEQPGRDRITARRSRQTDATEHITDLGIDHGRDALHRGNIDQSVDVEPHLTSMSQLVRTSMSLDSLSPTINASLERRPTPVFTAREFSTPCLAMAPEQMHAARQLVVGVDEKNFDDQGRRLLALQAPQTAAPAKNSSDSGSRPTLQWIVTGSAAKPTLAQWHGPTATKSEEDFMIRVLRSSSAPRLRHGTAYFDDARDRDPPQTLKPLLSALLTLLSAFRTIVHRRVPAGAVAVAVAARSRRLPGRRRSADAFGLPRRLRLRPDLLAGRGDRTATGQ